LPNAGVCRDVSINGKASTVNKTSNTYPNCRNTHVCAQFLVNSLNLFDHFAGKQSQDRKLQG
jgi:hypothetical protein